MPEPDGEYADLPGVGSCRVHTDEDRGLVDDDGVLADDAMTGERPLGVGRADDSSTLGGYPAVADREPTRPDEPVDGADADGVSATEDDGVFHAESRELESLDG